MYNYNYDPRIIVTLPLSDLRKIGRDALKGKWKIAAIGTLIYLALTTVPSLLLDTVFSGIGGFAGMLYTILLTGPFMFGYTVFMMNIFRSKEAKLTQLFDGFENVLKTMWLYLYMDLFIMLWTMLFVIPGIMAAIRYSQAFYILADNPEISVPQAVNESKRIMRGNVLHYFCLEFSFIGWIILVSLPSIIAGAVLGGSIVAKAANDPAIMNLILETTENTTDPNALMAALLPQEQMIGFQILSYVLSVGMVFVTPYMQTSMIAMYEIMVDNLRPKTRNFTVVPPIYEPTTLPIYTDNVVEPVKDTDEIIIPEIVTAPEPFAPETERENNNDTADDTTKIE